jgi:hypothetical protein
MVDEANVDLPPRKYYVVNNEVREAIPVVPIRSAATAFEVGRR